MPAYTTQGTPLTYIICYDDVLNHPDVALERVKEAPPMFYHGGTDMAYFARVGASDFRGKREARKYSIPLSPREARDRAQVATRWVSSLHESGVDIVIAYVCNQTLFGDPEARTGIWWFYDHWEEYTDDVGPKPEADPIDWLQREPDGLPHFNYPYRFGGDPGLRWAPCPNNPYFHEWLLLTVRLMAQYGYDGVFVDNNILHCHCRWCQKAFRDFLAETYMPAELSERFGTDDVSSLKLSTPGDKVLWAMKQEGFLQRIHDREPEEFEKKFGTMDLEKAVISEAGYGFLWGRANDFWREKVREGHTEAEADRILREGDVSSIGVETPEQLALWADTQRFWGWSIARRNGEIRAAARRICPTFLVVPNWGDMGGFDSINARRCDAKNPKEWSPGTDILFYEEEYFPGTLAPGYTFDCIASYKYSAACDMRPAVLPYRGADHTALIELATAEAAAFGGDGMFVQPGFQNPDVRERYREFYDARADWFRNRQSVANVGVYFSFDELHMENMRHLAEALMMAGYLSDHHVLFDFLCEGQLQLEEMSRFEVVILPHAEYLPREARTAIDRYLESGGCVLVTGNTGAFDGNGKPWSRDDLLESLRKQARADRTALVWEPSVRGKLAWIADFERWLPERAWRIHDLKDYHVGIERLENGLVDELVELAKREPDDDPRLAKLLDDMADRELSILPGAPPTLRAAVWVREFPRPSAVVHLVNYDIPGPGTPKDGKPVPVRKVRVSLPLPEAMEPRKIVAAQPEGDETDIPFKVNNDRVEFVVPEVEVYLAVMMS